MSISLKAEHLKHYKDVALLLFKYGRRDLVQRAGLSELLPSEPQHDRKAAAAAEEFAADIERLGPTFIKLGQLLSTRPDIVPPGLRRGAGAAAGRLRSATVFGHRRGVDARARRRAGEGVSVH